MKSIVILHRNGTTEHITINSCTNLKGVDISSNIYAKKASERYNAELQAYIFTEEDFNREMSEAQKHPLF